MIKNFSDYNESFNSSDLWTRYDANYDYRALGLLPISEEEAEEIRDLCSNLDIIYCNNIMGKLYPNGWDYREYKIYDGDAIIGHYNVIYMYISDISFISIYKHDDEWWTIGESWGENQIYYKCDQWDGFIECLKYIFESV